MFKKKERENEREIFNHSIIYFINSCTMLLLKKIKQVVHETYLTYYKIQENYHLLCLNV